MTALGPGVALAEDDGGGHIASAGVEAADAESAGEESSSGSVFFNLEPFQAPIVEKRRVKGYAQIQITLELRDHAGLEAVLKKCGRCVMSFSAISNSRPVCAAREIRRSI